MLTELALYNTSPSVPRKWASDFDQSLVNSLHKQQGGVAEWSNAPVLKTDVPQGTVGSNPTPSAILAPYKPV